MISIKIRVANWVLSGFFLLTGGTFTALFAQPSTELAVLQQKYPKRPVVESARRIGVTIDLVNNEPVITYDNYEERFVLADNATYLGDSREYFSNFYTIKKFEAYSLVPEQNQYKKFPVTKFTKSVDIDNSVYYDDQYAYNYTYPLVGKGTKLIMRAEYSTRYAYLPVVFYFGGSIPSESMELSITCIQDIALKYKLFGSDTSVVNFTKTSRGDKITYSWKANNPKSYEGDASSPSFRYYTPHLIVQIAGYKTNAGRKELIGSLADLYSFNYSHVSSLMHDPPVEIRNLSDSIVSLCKGDSEKVKCIYRWVQRNIKYVAIEDGDNGLVPREPDLVLKRRYGDCKDKTSLLVSMIKSQGLHASFAWIGSRSLPYKYSEFASVVNDDHMIAVWWENENQPVILDGTTFSHAMYDIPAFIQGKECLIEKGKDEYLLYTIPVAPPGNNTIRDSLSVELKGDTVTGRGYATFTGEQKADMMMLFDGKDTSEFAGIVRQQLSKASNKMIITSVNISDPSNADQPFKISYDFLLPDYISSSGSNRYINLYLTRFMQGTILRDDRWLPVESDMTKEMSYSCSFKIPVGFEVRQLPEGSAFSSKRFSFKDSYTISGNLIVLSSRVTLDFLVIEGDEVNTFRDMLALLNRNYLKSIPIEIITTP